jgi:hypothetical protein
MLYGKRDEVAVAEQFSLQDYDYVALQKSDR